MATGGSAGDVRVPDPAPLHPVQRALLAALPPALVSALGALATYPNIPTWYAGLAKPGFTPPNWVFAPVWTLLYAMMAYAAWRVLSLPADRPRRRPGLLAYAVQLALNAAWSWAFFALHAPALGLLVILALLAAIMATLELFWKLDRTAGLLLVPYLGWVSFAALLNYAILKLNP